MAIILKRFSRAIIHFDGDSFFASVEQIMNHKLKGKVVITGGERGAITSVSVEGKKMGIGRGISLRDAKKICPKLVVVRSDYTSYSIFAHRMYKIVREFTPLVEEYSIDECFADITGLDKKYGMSYAELSLKIKAKLEASLGVTFGVGLGPNKVIAKAASKHRKPAGFTEIKEEGLEEFLKGIKVEKLWGIGMSTAIYLNKRGVLTAHDFAMKTEGWLGDNDLSKPYKEMWQELHGQYVKELSVTSSGKIGSIIKSRTFSPPSMNRAYVFSQLSKNIENACIQIRRHRMQARHLRFYLKTQEFTYRGLDIPISVPLSTPIEMIKIVEENFDKVYRPNTLYRATGISLSSIIPEGYVSNDLFGESLKIEKSLTIFSTVDCLSRKYGHSTLFLGSSLSALDRAGNQRLPLKGDRWKKTIDIPFLGKVR